MEILNLSTVKIPHKQNILKILLIENPAIFVAIEVVFNPKYARTMHFQTIDYCLTVFSSKMEGFSLNDIQALSINRTDDHNGSFRKKKELVSIAK